MFADDDLPREKLPQTFPRKLEGVAVEHLNEYKAELLAEIEKIELEIKKRGSAKAQAETLFKS